jgi:hypothetical protein
LNSRLPYLLTVLLTASLTGALQAQVFPSGNGIVLTDKTQFDLYVQVGKWQDMRLDASDFRLGALRQLESALLAAGIARRPAHRNYLVCNVQATRTGNQVAYATSSEYWSLESTGVHVLQWQSSNINISTASRFSEGLIANECAASFLAEWQKWNP